MRSTLIAMIAALALVGGALLYSQNSPSLRGGAPALKGDNVRIEDGKQIVELTAKGGYFPGRSVAKAGIPTVLRFQTNGTFDCSAAIRIPSMNVSTFLPRSGSTDIDLGTPTPSTLHGTCAMGMYSFEIDFGS